MSLVPKNCYNCKHYQICRLQDKASELANYANRTGNLWGSIFKEKLYYLIGECCSVWRESEHE